MGRRLEQYDYDTAIKAGLGPDASGHWDSVASISDAKAKKLGLPSESGIILKSRKHPTFYKTVAGEDSVGRMIIRVGNRDYSVVRSRPTITSLKRKEREDWQTLLSEAMKAQARDQRMDQLKVLLGSLGRSK